MAVRTGHRDGCGDLAPLAWQQADAAGHLLARAFHRYPALTLLFPDERRRAIVTPHVWTAACRYSIHYGEVWVAKGFAGIACWLRPGATHKTLSRELRTGMASLLVHLSPAELIANIRNDLYAGALHARCAPAPHWYLFAIGVEPDCQGEGAGGALLRPMLARADREGVPVYLETHNLGNVDLYRHFGFDVAAEGWIPGSRVSVYGMLRLPERA